MSKSRIGQNFLYDPSILKRIIQIAKVSPEDTVVEIGPGPGRLTRLLAERAKKVIAIELDNALFEKLKAGLGDFPNLQLLRGDGLRFDYRAAGPFKVVANIPYYITTPLIFKLLEYRETLISMTLTLQKEVATRIAAGPGGKDYGVLSIMVQYYGNPSVKFIIPRGAFRPVPRVDSACLHLEVIRRPKVLVADEGLFFSLVRSAFSKRRKTLLNSLRPVWPDIGRLLESTGIDPERRAETLSIEEFALLANALAGAKDLPS